MTHKAVTSSNLRSVGYDEPTKTLEVTFHDGRTYTYADVPKAHYDGLMSAKSVGGYLHQHIRGTFGHAQKLK